MISGLKIFLHRAEFCPELCFTINGLVYRANTSVIPIDTSLNTFIREHANLSGTKFMCREGGCGVCTVTIQGFHPVSKDRFVMAVNSCLFPVYSCHGLEVTTVEALGNRKDGYHPIQKRLAMFNGSQCGFCTPGMIMNMYSLIASNEDRLTAAEVERAFGGNLCRCTGYRPILDAFKSVASDAPPCLKVMTQDIEDLPKMCSQLVLSERFKEKSIFFKCSSGREWYRAHNLTTVFTIMKENRQKRYMLVAGNTAHGVYRRSPDIKIFIDVTFVEALRNYSVEHFIELGGNVTLTETMFILRRTATTHPQFAYSKELVKHLDMVAHIAVRNVGTLAGNLMLKHEHPEFPSDVFLIMETVGAMVVIAENPTKTKIMPLAEFLKIDMKRKVILKICLPPLDPRRDLLRTFKIMPRAQNAHAYVNAGFLFRFNENFTLLQSARICYGGIHPRFIHADDTERNLKNTDIFDNTVLQRALGILNREIRPNSSIDEPAPEFRNILALGLFYKAVVNIAPDERTKANIRSGGSQLDRPISSGTQEYSSRPENYPLTKPLPKDTALEQTSGEAKYVNDMAHMRDDLWATFVLSTQANARIVEIDASEALNTCGVVAFFKASDIPGKNSFTTRKHDMIVEDEEIFASDRILYHSQPVGMIVADSFELAQLATKKIRVVYESFCNSDRILLSTSEVLKAGAMDRIQQSVSLGQAGQQSRIDDKVEGEKTISGRLLLGSQYPFHMEAQTCICVPSEQGLEVYSSTQWMDITQSAIAQSLSIHESQIMMKVLRIGGGFGAKISRPPQIACAAALASFLLNRTVRFVMTIEQNIMAIGKRWSIESSYEVVTDENGKILKLNNMIYVDLGITLNDNIPSRVLPLFSNGYINDSWYWQLYTVRTNKPNNTAVRGPGHLELSAMIENILEHIAVVTNQDPTDVRLANIPEESERRQFIQDFRESVEFRTRKDAIDVFNAENRWKKRGIAIVPMNYGTHFIGIRYALVSIHHGDGSVTITHGGIEMGQGINTKAAQVAAHVLGIDYSLVRVMPAYNFTSPNSLHSALSITTSGTAYAIQKACETLLQRIEPVRRENPTMAWPELIQRCFEQDVDLAALYMYNHSELESYDNFGVACADVEMDILTGNFLLNRVDILQDTGESMNPLLDVGQIEGAFVMGIGYWLHEKIIYSPNSGKLVTNRTWNYKIPGAMDIPVDFRIKFMQNHKTNEGVLGAKSIGEPPIVLSIVVLFALKYALRSARKDAGITDEWFTMGSPSTIEEILLLTGNRVGDFQL
ncbi:hypothetical protein DMENIID0001_017960 [Sergentomyia squamirostris]